MITSTRITGVDKSGNPTSHTVYAYAFSRTCGHEHVCTAHVPTETGGAEHEAWAQANTLCDTVIATRTVQGDQGPVVIDTRCWS